jgi:hypothetical protein
MAGGADTCSLVSAICAARRTAYPIQAIRSMARSEAFSDTEARLCPELAQGAYELAFEKLGVKNGCAAVRAGRQVV